ncbi:uncharacterized protein LOC142521744 [Primulina tabacum]|uniref:uncharacterized protein LOC142521744 n=1 Tax=Primulina tabacum TaxID=48773 RepID=UPI003F596D21
MTKSMGPPPPRNPSTAVAEAEPSVSESTDTTELLSPPPLPPNTSESEPESESYENHQGPQINPHQTDPSENSTQLFNPADSDSITSDNVEKKGEHSKNDAAVPYTIPEWSETPCHHFYLEVLKDGAIVNQFDVNKKGAYMFGRVDLCDFVLEHPTISRFHAVLQFKRSGDAYLYDLGSTHGTFINKNQVKKRVFVDLHVGDVIRFGQSSRLYIFQGPSVLMPQEADSKSLRKSKLRLEVQDMEASLRRARVEASRADGISWGMREDAVEETEEEIDEITWQTYKGQLTEKQEKTRDKVVKRLEKIGHMKKEINSIRVKDISQGGLTQGQQTQIARNEQRISQIMEELENLEETLNDSIRESLGARAGRLSRGKKKGATEDEEDYFSDDDDFYDRTQKSSKHKTGEDQSVETADSILDKKDAIVKKMEDKRKLLLGKDKATETNEVVEAGDELDAYMSAVSSQLVLDNEEKISKELSTLQSELDRILYLLKIADPTGEAARRREFNAQKPKAIVNHIPDLDKNGSILAEASSVKTVQDMVIIDSASKSGEKQEESESVPDKAETSAPAYTVTKPQWLGAVVDRKIQEIVHEVPVDSQQKDQFVDYKDRGTMLITPDPSQVETRIEDASPGLIIRKRKHVEISKANEVKYSESSVDSKLQAEDAVALLLKHSRGYHASDEEEKPVGENLLKNKKTKDGRKPHRVLGPERPSFLDDESDATWVPPEGQSGDGRTCLNDRLGY